MTFDLRLEVPVTVPPEGHSDVLYDTELDDVRSVLRDLCRSLEEVPGVRFIATIGGPMPVSVRRDLVVVVEQLCGVLTALHEEGAATLDLYEQGIEAQIVFVVNGEQMVIKRLDLLGRPAPACEFDVPRGAIVQSLRCLALTFLDVVARRSPDRTSHVWFADWARLLRAAANL